MTNDTAIYISIFMMAIVTFITRLLGPVIMKRVKISKRVESFLNGLCSSVLAAIVATAIVKGGYREAAAVAVACLIMYVFKSSIVAMLSGVAVAALWVNFDYLLQMMH